MVNLLEMTDEEIKKTKKDALVDLIFQLKYDNNNVILSMLRDMQQEFKELRNDIGYLEEENKKLREASTMIDHNVEFERENYDHMQYTRRNNVEISGIPEIFDNTLEDKVIDICNSLEIPIDKKDIESCHRMFQKPEIKHPKKTIVRFTNRRIAEQLKEKSKLPKEISESLGFPNNNDVYLSDNLCNYYKNLWYYAKKLQKEKQAKFVWTKNGIIRIRRDEGTPAIKINHLTDLGKNFPDFDFGFN